jgi:hypothetical protein
MFKTIDFYSKLIYINLILDEFRVPILGTSIFHPAVQSETFPSKIRVSALSVSGTCGRMGALLAPALIEATTMGVAILIGQGRYPMKYGVP